MSTPSSAVALPARLLLDAGRTRAGMLDGAWWPRSRDAEQELAVLIGEITAQVGAVYRIGLNLAAWDGRASRIVHAGRVTKVGWYGPSDPHAISVTGSFADRLDLLVVPPEAEDDAAGGAMKTASDPTSKARATEVLTAHGITTAIPLGLAPRQSQRTGPLPVGPSLRVVVANGTAPEPPLGATTAAGLGS